MHVGGHDVIHHKTKVHLLVFNKFHVEHIKFHTEHIKMTLLVGHQHRGV